jgi:hypothetical protein
LSAKLAYRSFDLDEDKLREDTADAMRAACISPALIGGEVTFSRRSRRSRRSRGSRPLPGTRRRCRSARGETDDVGAQGLRSSQERAGERRYCEQ